MDPFFLSMEQSIQTAEETQMICTKSHRIFLKKSSANEQNL